MGVIEEYEKFRKHRGGISEYSKLLNKCIKELKKKEEIEKIMDDFMQELGERLTDILRRVEDLEKKIDELYRREELKRRLRGDE